MRDGFSSTARLWGPGSAAPSRGAHYLHPGHLYTSASPWTVTTILGTCVAVCLWDAQAAVGGVNHYLLPLQLSQSEQSLRFGVVSIPRLFEQVLALGAVRGRLQAKLFGGMSSRWGFTRTGKDLGEANVLLARKLLDEAGVPVVASDVGGPRGRKLVFQLDDGVAWVKAL